MYSWTSNDGVIFHGQGWEPKQTKAVICLVHGLGEHSGRYAHVAEAFGRSGFALISFDLRGHGRTGGQRGHMKAFNDFMEDIDQLVMQTRYRYGELPIFLYGHSLGGMLVLNYVLRYLPDVNGVVASAPALFTPLRDQKIKVFLANSLAGFFPTMSMPTGLDPNTLSHDPEIVQRYQADSNVHDQATLSMAKLNFEAIDWLLVHASEFPLPLLLIHGGADRLVYAAGSQEFARMAPNATLKIWDDLYHEVHNEPENEMVFAYVLSWLDHHMPKGENE